MAIALDDVPAVEAGTIGADQPVEGALGRHRQPCLVEIAGQERDRQPEMSRIQVVRRCRSAVKPGIALRPEVEHASITGRGELAEMTQGQYVAPPELGCKGVVGCAIEARMVVKVPVDKCQPMAERACALVMEGIGEPPEGELEQRLPVVVGRRHARRSDVR